MVRVPRPPDMEPPPEVLKIVGSPQPQDSDTPTYSVHLALSRRLTAGEEEAAARLGGFAGSPAGWVQVSPDKHHLIVTNTTLEKIAEHKDSLSAIVFKIATDGEEYRRGAVEAQRQVDEANSLREAERARRKNLASEIKFD